jgi:hypothetical protein
MNGPIAAFLLPSLKLKQRSLEEKVHEFLLEEFGGYTATAGNIYGYWKDESGNVDYGEHKEYKVALLDDTRLPALERFLADIGTEMNEKCIYLEAGKEARFVNATPRPIS